MRVYELYSKLKKAESGSRYLVLAKVFETVFGRKLHQSEWGFLRRLIKLYGAETVFWALISSFSIDSKGTPLKYVATVCRNTAQEQLETQPRGVSQELSELLDYMKNYKQPDWEKILNASD